MAPSAPLVDVEAALCEHFAQRAVRASVSFVGVQPLEVLRFEPIPGERVYVSLGMSRDPMHDPTSPTLDDAGPRAELMLHVRDPIDRYAEVWRQLAVLAAAPTVEGVVYADGVTVDTEQPLVDNSLCTGGVVIESPLAAIETSTGHVSVLQLLPATAHELAWSRVKGSAALRARWTEHGVDLLDLARRAADLG
jgi:Suppressor of fused protein (SUFU)